MTKKYGLLLDIPSDKDFVFGVRGGLPMEVVNPSRDWRPYMGTPEYQNLNGVEPYACVIFTILNCVEALIFKKYGEKTNWSDRFLATLVNTRGQGSSPRTAADVLRKEGVPPEEVWAFDALINTEDKFFMSLPEAVREVAKLFNIKWEFGYDFLIPNHASITSALECSPVLLAVAAWFKNAEGKYYKPDGFQDNHATTLVYEKEGEYMQVFDSYADGEGDPALKELTWDSLPVMAMRFSIKKREGKKKESFLEKLIALIKKIW